MKKSNYYVQLNDGKTSYEITEQDFNQIKDQLSLGQAVYNLKTNNENKNLIENRFLNLNNVACVNQIIEESPFDIEVLLLNLKEKMSREIQTYLDQKSLARKFLVVDPIPQGALARYTKDKNNPAFVAWQEEGHRNPSTAILLEGADYLCRTENLISHPKVSYQEMQTNCNNGYFYTFIEKCSKEFLKLENAMFIELLHRANLSSCDAGRFERKNEVYLNSDAVFDKNNFLGKYVNASDEQLSVILNKRTYEKYFEDNHYNEIVNATLNFDENFAFISGNFHFYITSAIPEKDFDEFYCIDSTKIKGFLGYMPVRQEITVIPADRPEKLKYGWVIFENIGMSIANGENLYKIIIQ